MTLSVFGDNPLVFLIGGLGAGKTELALNIAVMMARKQGPEMTDLIDLDIVNPFFRVRRLGEFLKEKGVTLVAPDQRVSMGDLPALPGKVNSSMSDGSRFTICDVGGGELGLRILPRIKDVTQSRRVRVFFVVNPFRPDFMTAAKMIKSFKRLSEVSALAATHIIANPNLGTETGPEAFNEGFDAVRKLSDETETPIVFAAAQDALYAELTGQKPSREFTEMSHQHKGVPLFPLFRFWATPWRFGLENEDDSRVND